MKRLSVLFLAFIALTAFWACSDDEDNFPAPSINGGQGSLTENISKDTANVYKLVRKIESEAGIKEIILTNKTANKELNKVTSFTNPNSYTYTFDVDLSEYKSNTQVVLNLSIIDNAGNITNQEITLTIVVPEVKIYFPNDDEVIQINYPQYYLSIKVKCGSAELKTASYKIGSGASTTLTVGPRIEDTYYFDLYLENLSTGDNNVVIDVEDSFGRTATKTTKIVVKEAPASLGDGLLVTPESLANKEVTGEDGYEIRARLDEAKRIKWIRCQYMEIMEYMGMPMPMPAFEEFNFSYNENNTVAKLVYGLQDAMTNNYAYTVFEYKYKTGTSQLEEIVTYEGADEDGNKATGASEKVYASNFEYDLGVIIKYKVDGKDYTPKYVDAYGEKVRVDHLNYANNAEALEYTLPEEKAINPFYNSLVPEVVMVGTERLPLNILFYNKYAFTGLKGANGVVQEYTIQKDGQDRLTNLIWVGKDTELRFTYNN